MAIYLGCDASTQSLTAILLRVEGDTREIITERAFTYDQELPQYGTVHGALPHDDPAIVQAPPVMWADALDRMIGALVESHPREMLELKAIAGSAQQHGSVYLHARFAPALAALDPRASLAAQIGDVFSRPLSPIWMDSSTTIECREIEAAVGGDAVLAQHTGSRAFERFTGPQIRRFFKTDPAGYAATSRIHLISSFLATLLAGHSAAIDPSDGSGMSLMDLATSTWWPAALDATAPDLASKLPSLDASSAVAGSLSPYWRARYGLPPARVIVWSGDNGCSMVGAGLVNEGGVGISLGTSDVVFGPMTTPRVSDTGDGHVYGSPAGGFMGLTVFKNGSLARERVRDAFGFDWAAFSRALRSTPPGNNGAIMLPWFDPEITPHVSIPGVRRIDLSPDDAAANVRAIVEAQMMAMANHAGWMGVRISSIHATGGASANLDVLQVMADVFGARVYRQRVGNSACLGAALRAWHADALASGTPLAWRDIVRDLAAPLAGSLMKPVESRVAIYRALRERYRREESRSSA